MTAVINDVLYQFNERIIYEYRKVYSKRIVAFIDILGFKDHVKKSSDDLEHANAILNATNLITNIQKDTYEGFLSKYPIGKEVTVFSDSIIISYPLTLGGSVFYILLDLIHIQMDLLFHGFLFRGGVVVGDAYHNRNVVFGPAIIDAYQLESKHAIYPRIILKNEVIIEGGRNAPSQNTLEMELEYISDLVREDTDGFYYVDYLRQYEELDREEDYLDMLIKVKELIIFTLETNQDKTVLKKFKWLRVYYNQTIDDIGMKNKRKWKIPKRIKGRP